MRNREKERFYRQAMLAGARTPEEANMVAINRARRVRRNEGLQEGVQGISFKAEAEEAEGDEEQGEESVRKGGGGKKGRRKGR